jgi:hypothetical protein
MYVRVVSPLPSSGCPEGDYVLVHTWVDPANDTVTLATIERVVDKTNVAKSRSGLTKRIKALVVRRPMSPNDALKLATSYAERKKIPVVYTDRD